MKKFYRILACGALLLQGCYVHAVWDAGEGKRPPDNEAVRLSLANGSMIESEAFHHFAVTAPSNFIYGAGTSQRRSAGKEFVGRIDPSAIDSSKSTVYDGVRYRTFWMKDSVRVRFRDGEYVVVTPDQRPGLWCIGRVSDATSDSLFAGRIDFSDVQTVEVKYVSIGLTIVLVIAGALAATFLGMLLAFTIDPP